MMHWEQIKAVKTIKSQLKLCSVEGEGEIRQLMLAHQSLVAVAQKLEPGVLSSSMCVSCVCLENEGSGILNVFPTLYRVRK